MNAENKKQQPESEIENLIDGKSIDVEFTPEAAKKIGKKGETVRVRKIPIFDMEPLGRVFGQIAKEAALYCERDDSFVRSLTEDSFASVLEEGRKLNFTSFKRWFRWQDQTLDGLGQAEDKDALIQKVVDKLSKDRDQAGA
jgi:hypothetical protein